MVRACTAHAPRIQRTASNGQQYSNNVTVCAARLACRHICSVATSALQDATLKEKEPEVSEPQEEVSSCW